MTLNVCSEKQATTEVEGSRSWNKYERANLDADIKAKFEKLATGYALSKHNKLTVFSTAENSDGKLEHVHNLQLQLRLLGQHMYKYDMDDVLTIVVPQDVHNTSDLEPQTFNLLTDFQKLHESIVANSNAWYNLWASDSFIKENMTLILDFFQNNTTEELWNKCIEEYQNYHPVYQGGPLMIYLILKRIHSNSEAAITHLIAKVKGLRSRRPKVKTLNEL